MRQELRDLKEHIYEDGSISEAEVGILLSMFKAYGFGQDEAKLLLDLNNILTGTPYPRSFETLFLESLSGFLLGNDGQVTEANWSWFTKLLMQDGAVDGLERKLVESVAARAKTPPDLSGLL